MTANEIVEAATADIQKYVNAALSTVLASIEAEERDTEAEAKSTIASRKKALAKAVKSLDVDTLERVEKTFVDYVPNLATIDPELVEELNEEQQLAIGEEYVRYQQAKEFLEVRHAALKELVFGHVDATVGAHENGEIKLPQIGKVLRREGAGRTDPIVDTAVLRRSLPTDVVGEIFETVEIPEQLIPAHTEEVFSEENLIAVAARRPEIFAVIREALIPGKQKTEKFVVRDLNE
ncbi:conserved hypothetical protein [Rhodococcus phage E3]|uniref:hypothetical protein n=1 Tax=Rhodococcus phage E3 TaxID=1007869 RepID=UPI0002C6ACC5|nr:hypothetical protein M176_gp149 [Rhodococcus phage E3]AEQ21057.1 conserved hypothetical protein [Rhodococcus phage E3]